MTFGLIRPHELIGAAETTQDSMSPDDYVPPESPAQARRQDWPATAEEAVAGMLRGPAFRQESAAVLSDGVRSAHGGRVSARFAALDSKGATIAVFSVDRLVGGVWAVGHVEQCV